MKQQKIRYVIALQLMVLLFSFSSMLSKFAARFMREGGIFDWRFISTMVLIVSCLAVYAYFWQKILKVMDLSTAYLSKGMSMLWSLLWSLVIFKEYVSIQNFIGVALIVLGIVILNQAEIDTEKEET